MTSGSISSIQAALKAQKHVLRKTTTTVLRQLSSMQVDEQSRGITDLLVSLQAFRDATSISCYLNMPTAEARTSGIVDSILQTDKFLFVPKIQSKEGKMDFLRVYSAADLTSLPGGTWGIKEPGDTWEGETRASALGTEERLDMIVLPGVAFDSSLFRLGHGKGYYDRFISAYVASGRPKPLLVGVCLREQLLPRGEEVPHEEHDWQVDLVITPDEIIR